MNKFKVTQSDIHSIEYFFNTKGDVTCWASWEERKPAIEAELPELVRAIENLTIAEKTLSRIVSDIYRSVEDYPYE